MSYNRKLLKQMTEESKQKKPQPKPKDRIVDPMGQWNYPGEITRIPSNRITMQGVPYPVLGRGSDGSEQIMYPEQEYVFSGSDYVDEFPLVKAQTGINLNLPQFKNEEERKFSVNPYTFGFSPAQNVNIYGIGASPSLNVFRNKKNRFDLTGDVSSSSISYPGGVELFGKPQFSGGLRFTHTFRNGGEPTPLELAKIKAKMALESHFGNPSARRMTTPYPQDLAFKLNAGPNKGKMGYGTHWMRTIDNYAIPNIQEGSDGKLFFNQNASSLDREAMRFNSPKEALMFAENYKEVAPMSRSFKKNGGESYLPKAQVGKNVPSSTYVKKPIIQIPIGPANDPDVKKYFNLKKDETWGSPYEFMMNWYSNPTTKAKLKSQGFTGNPMKEALNQKLFKDYLDWQIYKKNQNRKDAENIYPNDYENNRKLRKILDKYIESVYEDKYKRTGGFHNSDDSTVAINKRWDLDHNARQRTAVHELTHATPLDNYYTNYFKTKKPKNPEAKEKEYFDKEPGEIYPRIMDLRFQMNLKPGRRVTPEMLKDYYNDSDYDLKNYYSPKELADIMNEIAYNPKTKLSQSKNGGDISIPDLEEGNWLNRYDDGGSLPKFQIAGQFPAYARGPMRGDIQMRGNVNIPTQMAYDASKIRQAQAAEQAARTRTTIGADTRTAGERQKAREFTEQVNKRRKEMGLLEGTGYLKDREKANKILSNIMTPLEAASYVTGVGSIGSNFLRLGASALEKQIGKNLVSKGLKNATSYINPIINKADEALAYAQLDPIGIMGNKLNRNLYNPTTAINRANNTIIGIDRNLKNSGVEATDLVLGDGLNNTKNLVNLATNTESILPKSSVKDAFKNTGVTLNEFIGELISGKSNRKSIEEGNQWLQNWISHPTTQAKIEKDMNNAIKLRSSVSNNTASDVYDLELLELIKNQSKNFKPVSKEYSLKKQLEENLKQYFTNKNLQNVHADNWGVSYMHGYSPEARNRIASGITLPPNRYGSWVSRTPTMNQTERVGTTIHEGTHDWVSNAALKKSGMRNEVLSSMDPKIKNDFLEWETLRNSGQDPKKIMGEARAHQAYLADPTEVHARIMELRKHLGITPETVVNEKYANEVIDYLKALPENKRPIDIKLLNVIKGDPKKLSNLFNKLWAASPYAIPAAGVLGASQQKKQGGQTNWLDKYN